MKKIGLFYGGTTAKTAVVALKIQEAFAENEVVLIPIEGARKSPYSGSETKNAIPTISSMGSAFWRKPLPKAMRN